MHHADISVLMVCLGNICRSPMAEALLRHHAESAGIGDRIHVDSAGTGDWHVGSRPHPETCAELRRNDIDVGNGRARQVTPDDLTTFDYVFAMDASNLDDLQALAARTADTHARVELLLPHGSMGEREVPDPYLVGGYDHVFTLVDDACRALVIHLRDAEGIG